MHKWLNELGYIFDKKIGEHSVGKLFFIHDIENTIIESQLPFIKVVTENLNNVHVAFYDDRSQINAFSAIIEDMPVIGIYTGSILKIVDVLKLKFINWGNVNQIESVINSKIQNNVLNIKTLNNYSQKAKISFDNNNNLVIDYNWGNLDNSSIIVCELILNLALNFIVYHEIGHVLEGHLAAINTDGSFLNMSSDCINETVELEADLYAVKRFYEQIDFISNSLFEKLKIDKSEKYPLALTYIIEVITLTYYLLRPIEKGEYLSLGVRTTGNLIYLHGLIYDDLKLRNSLTKNG